LALRGDRSRPEQLSLLQGLHDGMPVECEPGIAQGRVALRANPARRPVLARAADWFGGFSGPPRLPMAVAGQSDPGLVAGAQLPGESAGHCLAAAIAALHAAAVRPVVPAPARHRNGPARAGSALG